MSLPPGWTGTTLGDVAEVLDRFRVPVNSAERAHRQGIIPYYGATGRVGWIDDYLFDEELILLGEDGAPFLDSAKPKAYLIRGKSWVNNHAHVLQALGGVSNAFLMYQLNILDYGPYVSGTTRLKLPQAPMVRMPVRLAPVAEQHRIVAEIEKQLTRLDAAVAALERARANLKRYRASVLKAAVEGRLVQTEAELAAAHSHQYETALAMLRRHGIEGRPHGEEGWAIASVGSLAGRVQYGSSAKTSDDETGIPVIRMGNISDGKVRFDQMKYLPEGHTEFPELLLSPGDVLFNRTNSAELVGKSAVFKPGPRMCSFASYLIRVQLHPVLAPELLVSFLNSSKGKEWIKAVVSQQVGQANVNGSKLKALEVPVPPTAEQERIVAEVERRFSVLDVLESTVDHALKRAERIRQSVLKRAFEGGLVPQDPADEPAEALLARIRAERARSVAPATRRRGRAGRQLRLGEANG